MNIANIQLLYKFLKKMETLWEMYQSPEVTSSLTFSAMMEMLVSVKFLEHARLDSGVGLGVEVQCIIL